MGGGGDDGHSAAGVHIEYEDLYAVLVFFATTYIAGQISSRFLKMPGLVGEIFAGLLLGPPLLDYAPYPEALVMLGEVGLILLVLEAGIDIDLVTLKLIGARGCLIAILGSVLPIVIGFAVAIVLGNELKAAIAAGACFGPTSLGIALNILRAGNILNTPTGQLIIAAAIIDDMIALVILSQLEGLAGDVTIQGVLIPVVSALGFLLLGGYLAIAVLPKYVTLFLDKYAPENRGFVATGIMFALMYAMIPATYYSKASYLMGAFISGLLFCSDNDLHHNFVCQYKRLMQWLIRIFFAASIGFQVPIKDFANGEVLWQGLLFTLSLIGKIGVGFLVPNFSQGSAFKGEHFRDCLIVGFSMMAEGEFALVIAVFSVDKELISPDLYASVVLAILLSTVIAPFSLRAVIKKHAAHAESKLNVVPIDSDVESVGKKVSLFVCIQYQTMAKFGLFQRITKCMFELGLDIIDHRSTHEHGNELFLSEVYARDANFVGPIEDAEAVTKRLAEIQERLMEVIDQPDTATVEVGQWAPGIAAKGGNSSRVSDFQFLFEAAQEESMHGNAKIFKEEEKVNDKPQLPDGGEGRSRLSQNSTGLEDLSFRTSATMHNRVSEMLGGVEAAEVQIGRHRFPIKLGQRTIEALKAAKPDECLELILSQGRRVRIDSGLQGFIRGSTTREELPIDDALQPATGRSGRRRVNSGLDGMLRGSGVRSDWPQGRSRRTKAHSDLGAFFRATTPARVDQRKLEELGVLEEK
mmetsp:Transcript_21549/g.32903  ORF Transcript_21549/g.32903 Transcript_21549/m.32903 type:complete len:751 (-) Transcript_21549:87-2339(-)|eukprot:CAMPEP_0196811792 /NCGR_PEP_ID=MMETSP1362-20130617/20057_1 /TAXON_ID=163516 /ORGANISM="Leptocylindrus danicus, Strain CCMP1856" /LENGTH=750 /DNA_ID=CAMNT_0042187175 /DNA_START=162 /DNA_END=2414 /DNA_ORIENTATION=+